MFALCQASLLDAAEPRDLLRFTNGDLLHGSFLGIKSGPQAIWKRGDVSAALDFKKFRWLRILVRWPFAVW